MSNAYQCDKHPSHSSLTSWCPDCMEAFANRRDPSTMTNDEKADELIWWGSILTIPFGDLHERFEELVGRPIWTHEFAGQAMADRLIEEARTGRNASFEEVLDKVPGDKPIIVIDMSKEE